MQTLPQKLSRKTLKEQFEDKYIPEPNSGCWLWEGALSPNGYGHIRRDGKIITAHKVSYILNVGEVPDGYDVCHTCDNRMCVNPSHLWLGTRSQNLQDMLKKSRHNRKLTYDQAQEIKSSPMKNADLARKFNCSDTLIYYIKTGQQWKH